jgi:hypothetical protein
LNFNHLATVSTRWRTQKWFESLSSRQDKCIALPQRYIELDDFEQCLESPRPYPQHGGMQNNES